MNYLCRAKFANFLLFIDIRIIHMDHAHNVIDAVLNVLHVSGRELSQTRVCL
jgi:hypothetical protein